MSIGYSPITHYLFPNSTDVKVVVVSPVEIVTNALLLIDSLVWLPRGRKFLKLETGAVTGLRP